VANEKKDLSSFFWVIVAVAGLIIWANAQTHRQPPTTPVKPPHTVVRRVPVVVHPIPAPTTPVCNYTPPPGQPNLLCDKDGHWKDIGNYSPGSTTNYSPGTITTGHSGYENPAPGDDGTADCSPGQAPVYVGTNDPNGLDRDGDGIGCE
jgi:hypothetical protein